MKTDRRRFLQFIRGLADLLDAGLPVRKALESMMIPAKKTRCAVLADSVLRLVLEGYALSSAIRHNPLVYVGDDAFSLMAAAEKTGSIVPALRFIISTEEQREETASHLKEVSLYPALVLCVAVAGTIVLLRQYRQFAFSQPPEGASASLMKAGLFLLLYLSLFCFVYYQLFKTDGIRLFFYETGFLLSSGLSVTDALHIISGFNDRKAASYAELMLPDVRAGISFAEAFRKICPELADSEQQMFLDLSSVNGNLASACRTVWKQMQKKSERRQQLALRMAEPLLLTGTGICLLILLEGAVLPFLTQFGGVL